MLDVFSASMENNLSDSEGNVMRAIKVLLATVPREKHAAILQEVMRDDK